MPAWTGMGAVVANTAESPAISSAWTSTAYAANDTTFVVESPKDETVYAKTDASGKVQGVYVVNRFAAGSGIVMDPANYLSMSNMTTSNTLVQENGKVEVSLQGAEPFYYEGVMAAETALPWNISLTYYLDGKEIAPEELGGASGKLRIERAVTARTSAPEASVADFANSYVLQAQGTFDSATFEMDENDSVMVAQVGGEAVVNCMVLPGESQTFVLEGTAGGFTSSGWQISALPLSLAISIADQDTSQLTSATAQLESATSLIASGSDELSAGMDEAVSGFSELSAGVGVLSSGVGELSAGMGELDGNSEALLEGWDKINSGASELAAGASELAAGGDTFRETVEEAESEVSSYAMLHNLALRLYNSALQKYAESPTEANKASLDSALESLLLTSQAQGAQEALGQVLDGYAQLEEGIDAVNGGAGTLASGTQEFDEYIKAYVAGVTAAADGVEALTEGIAKLVSGTSDLSSGAAELQKGADALAIGSAQLAASVKGMDAQLLAGIQAVIDEKLGADFKPHSFVAPENTSVSSVQFVYMVEGISADDDGSASADENAVEATETVEEELGLIDRIIAWFKGLFG